MFSLAEAIKDEFQVFRVDTVSRMVGKAVKTKK
jgi:hypothetical protein